MNKFIIRQSMILFMAATVWGVAFVAQSVGMDYVGPYTFIAVRNVVALVVLVPCAVFMHTDRERKYAQKGKQKGIGDRWHLLWCLSFYCEYVTAIWSEVHHSRKSGIYHGNVPYSCTRFWDFSQKKTGMRVWIAVGLASLGLYLLCITKGDFRLQKGDLYMLGCATVFAVHILVVDHFSPLVDGVKLSCVQTFTNAMLGAIMMLLLEQPHLSDIFAAWLPILYAGVLSSGVGYTFQIIGQKGMNPTAASLILSLESVISVLAGWLLLHQVLTAREAAGCVLAFAAIILVQLPGRRK